MNNDVAEASADLIAGEAGRTQVWSVGPFDRPAAALRFAGAFLADKDRELQEQDGEAGMICVVEDLHLQRVGRVYWLDLQIDGASCVEFGTPAELREARR